VEAGELFTRAQAVAAGEHDRTLTRLVRTGAITRVARGVYRTGTASLPDPEAIVHSLKVTMSHTSATAWYGAALVTPLSQLHLTAPRCRGRWVDELPGVRIHRADLRDDEMCQVQRIRTTSPMRTALDLTRSLATAEAVASLDNMCRLGLITSQHLETTAVGLARGPGRKRAVSAAQLVDPRAESVFESMNRVEMALAGLPAPIPQLDIYDRDGHWIARVDFGWPNHRVILECDGWEFHNNRDSFERDRRRWTALTRAGWKVVVVTWRATIDDPPYLIDVMSDLVG
jgi:Transcriptional regulator, AbiEi antitoxin